MIPPSSVFSIRSISSSSFRARGGGGGVLDINLFRVEKGNDPERIRDSQRQRFASVDIVDQVIVLHKAWRQRQFELDNLRKDNKLTKEIGHLMVKEDAAEAIEGLDDHKNKMAEKDESVKAANTQLDAKLMTIVNFVHDSVPVSNDEANNLVVRNGMSFGQKGT